jgi:hypothetical protein
VTNRAVARDLKKDIRGGKCKGGKAILMLAQRQLGAFFVSSRLFRRIRPLYFAPALLTIRQL